MGHGMTHRDRHELHPLCTLFPRLTGAEFEALREDIRANGLREPILLHEGMILDGGNRYEACLQADVTPVLKPFEGGDIVAYVLSANLYRRHLSPGQNAAIVASITNWAEAHKPGRPKQSGNVAALSSVAARAAKSGASERTQRMADKVAQADPALAMDVAHGKTTLPQAVAKVGRKAASPQASPLAGARPSVPETPALPAEHAAERAPDLAEAFESPAELLADLERENRELQAQVEALLLDDQHAQTLQLRRALQVMERRCNEHLGTIAARDREIARLSKQIKRCGKAVGQDDPDQVAAAVEALARRHASTQKEPA